MASQNLRTKQQFLYELERFHNETYAKALLVDPEAFFQPAQQGWSVAENFTHITKVARTMALIFAPISAPVIGMMGHHTGELSQLKQMMLDYHAGLKKGFNAGPFRPTTESPSAANQKERKDRILEEWKQSWKPIAERLQKFDDEKLMRRQFYHPLLGKVILMDMAYMAIFHSMHHLMNAERKSGLDLLPPSFLD